MTIKNPKSLEEIKEKSNKHFDKSVSTKDRNIKLICESSDNFFETSDFLADYTDKKIKEKISKMIRSFEKETVTGEKARKFLSLSKKRLENIFVENVGYIIEVKINLN